MEILVPNLRSLRHEKECETKIVARTPSSGISRPNFHNRRSDSLDTILYVPFAIQNLKFYGWKLRDRRWALSWHRTHTIFAPWSDVAPCFTSKQTERKEVFSFVSYSRFKTFQFHWEIFISIVSVYPYERGSVSTVVCHLFVVRLPERSAVRRQAFCVVSGEASANSERPSRSHFLFEFRQQAALVKLITRPFQRCVFFFLKIGHKLTSNEARKECLVTVVWARMAKKKKEEMRSSFRITDRCFRINMTMSRSREFSCVFSSLIV